MIVWIKLRWHLARGIFEDDKEPIVGTHGINVIAHHHMLLMMKTTSVYERKYQPQLLFRKFIFFYNVYFY